MARSDLMQESLGRQAEEEKAVRRFAGSGCEEVAVFLARIASIRGDPPDGYAYSSPERLLLERGRAYHRKALPEDVEWGVVKQCFDNARALAMADPDRFAYCEGWAYPGSAIAVHHAWVVDLVDGMAVDPTWRPKLSRGGTPQYLGIAFALDHMIDAINRSGTVLDDYAADHPILTGAIPDAEWMHPSDGARAASVSAAPRR